MVDYRNGETKLCPLGWTGQGIIYGMSKPLSHPSKKAEQDSARAYVRVWNERTHVLESERLRMLRALSELDAARCFVLLQGYTPTKPKPTSGLVEQQRVLNRLRQTSA